MALLLLRAVLGLAVLMQGGLYLQEPGSSTERILTGVAAFVAGGLLVVGFLTPVVAVAIAIGAIGLAILPMGTAPIFESRTAMIFGWTILLALVGLGPGAVSIDARMFGRREIIIPPASISGEVD